MLDGSLRVAPLKHVEAHSFLPAMLAARPRRGGESIAPFRAQGLPWRWRGGRAKEREEQRLQDRALYGRGKGGAAAGAGADPRAAASYDRKGRVARSARPAMPIRI